MVKNNWTYLPSFPSDLKSGFKTTWITIASEFPDTLKAVRNFRRSYRVIVSVLVLLYILFTIGNNVFEFDNVDLTRYTNLLAVTQSGWKSSSIDTFDLTTAIQKKVCKIYFEYKCNP